MTGADERLVQPGGMLNRWRERLTALWVRADQACTQAEALKRRLVSERLEAAAQAERVADQADAFADYLERRAVGPERDRRLEMAERERMTAALERRNAARLRAAGPGPVHLESPISLDPGPGPAEGR